jgi:topoisomerase-4 subunit B
MPDLIKNGHLYIIDAPLFIATGAKVKAFGMTRAEVDKKMKALKCTDYTVSRLKGWGEANAEQLSELCLNPNTRKLIQLQWNDLVEKACENTMGEDTAFRKELLGISK